MKQELTYFWKQLRCNLSRLDTIDFRRRKFVATKIWVAIFLSATAVLFALVGDAFAAETVDSCSENLECHLQDRSYQLLLPDEWDGKTAMPILLHFHGWGRKSRLIVKHRRIAAATVRRGVLLVAPNGRNGTWQFWQQNSEDVTFASEVLQDVARRYPVDHANVFISGYSYGAAMAWRYACDRGFEIRALLAISGMIPLDQACSGVPQEVRHVHGLSDTVMRFPITLNGNTDYPLQHWREELRCHSSPVESQWQARKWLRFRRWQWSNCGAGQVIFDSHPSGHFIPHGWIARQLDELLDIPYSYP